MPVRNVRKEYVPESYYHIYNRGVNKRAIFNDDSDYIVFLSLLKRYLSSQPAKNVNGINHPNYWGKFELLAFCLMSNHYHMLIYQTDSEAMKKVMQSVGVAYSMYFNKKNRRQGPLFQQRYKASRINNDSYLLHISRYIHQNPGDYLTWRWSSLPYYRGELNAEWIRPGKILELFEGDDYLKFVHDYNDSKLKLEDIKRELADH